MLLLVTKQGLHVSHWPPQGWFSPRALDTPQGMAGLSHREGTALLGSPYWAGVSLERGGSSQLWDTPKILHMESLGWLQFLESQDWKGP